MSVKSLIWFHASYSMFSVQTFTVFVNTTSDHLIAAAYIIFTSEANRENKGLKLFISID